MRGVTEAIEPAPIQSNSKRRNWKRRSERILVAVNLSEEGGALVTWALTHGSRSGDSVTVIHVVDQCASLATRLEVSVWEKKKKDMLHILRKVVTYCRDNYDVPTNLSVVVRILERQHEQSRGDAIVKEARTLEATQVILGKHKSRRLDMSRKRMTDLGRLCVENLESYCDVLIVRNGKILIRRPGTAKFRRSLEALFQGNKTEESNELEDADKDGKLVVGGLSQLGHRSRFGSKDASKKRFSSERSFNAESTTNSSRDSSFCDGSESSPSSVLRIPDHHGKSPFSRDKMDGGFSLSASFASGGTPSRTPFSSQAELWLKGSTDSAGSTRSRSSSQSLELVPELSELPAEAENRYRTESAIVLYSQPELRDRKEDPEEKLAIVCYNPPELEDRKEDPEEHLAIIYYDVPELEDRKVDPEEQLAIVCYNPPELEEDRKDGEEFNGALVCYSPQELEDRKDKSGGNEERAPVLVGSRLLELESDWKDEEGEREGEEDAPVCKPSFPPPKFARSCSDLKYNLSEEGLQSLSTDVKVELPEVRRFSYEELRAITDDFSPSNIVGTGGASTVFKAQLSDGRRVALKRLVENMAGEKEFMMEMMMLICTLYHPNLVTMIGFCAEESHHLIAYELLTRGSLERNLHEIKSRKLNWAQRQKVAFGASRGLAYLHSFSPKPIIHRDIKTSNILLADDFEAQISDFGLARWLSDCDTTDDQVSCAGTFGYLAPECLMYGGFNARTDVFAFGVVLLELISGRRPMDDRVPESEQSLVLWARTLQQNGQTHLLVDRRLKGINPQEFKRMMYAAFLCVQVSPEDRPTMDRVVRLLDPSCNYSPAILQPNISAPPFMSMPELNGSRHQSPLALASNAAD